MDDAELRAQLDQLHPVAYGWALHCCRRDGHEAEDVLHIAYQKILQGKARYTGRSAFKTWLFGVVRLTAANERRRHWLRRLRFAQYEPPVTSDTGLSDVLLAALGKLPRRQHEVLHLVFYQDLTIEEAAKIMGVSLGSARTHYARGKQRLAEFLHDER
jgi:RNA polymerase sigma-70 factor (ECF subfamily)